jgi:hypothetical protein
MPERLVRFNDSFFDDLDDQLPSERSASGSPSATDFLLYDLPRLRDTLAAHFDSATVPVPGYEPLRVLIAAGTLVASVALYALLGSNGDIFVVALEIEQQIEEDAHDND